ncbi:hydratase [Mycolicibacterium murale]|uniref:Hydratase n=1 Tax=Mycolicibacterium murale TaxID=182220 RepID=A0A7I9WW71_9MYCO|nr:nitrilase-related carbon-nitrogen hydrolase [Mycolicibacterium murale]MCV7181959.1 hydratase [Mycolicibacterium murale]GFG61457.1 hydratase [Mycolicibacterium murale]
MIRVASVQTDPTMLDVSGNVDAMVAAMHRLAAEGVQLAVFPELATTGYMFADADECRTVSEEVPAGPTCARLLAACTELGMHIVFGIAERDGERLYNSSALLGPDGFIGRYRKLHLWDQENVVFSPGDVGLPVYDTAVGSIGILICYDIWFPEAARTLALAGADLLCVPTNWVPLTAGNDADGRAMANILCSANSHCNGVPIVAADRCGTERGQEFLGRSVITAPSGWYAAGPASPSDEDVIIADLDLSGIGASRQLNQFNNTFADRRLDAYRV